MPRPLLSCAAAIGRATEIERLVKLRERGVVDEGWLAPLEQAVVAAMR